MNAPRTIDSLLVVICSLLPHAAVAQGDAVASVATGRLNVVAANSSGQLALYSEADLSTPHSGISRAILVFHGLHRNRLALQLAIPC